MSDWAFELETYKITVHLLETIVQALIWPLVAFIAAVGIYKIFGTHFATLLFNTAKLIGNVESFHYDKLAMGIKKDVKQIEKEAEKVITKTDVISSISLIESYFNQIKRSIESLQELVFYEQERGNLIQYCCNTNYELFFKSIFDNDEFAGTITVYEKMKS